MIEYFILFLVLIVFTLASIEDLKKREVYDYLNYSFTFIVLVTAIFHSIYTNNFDPIKYVGFGLLIGFALGSIIYYLGIWGGGDAKFLIGFSASSYYLLNFINASESNLSQIYEYFMNILSNFLFLFTNFFINYIVIIDLIFLIFIIIRFFISKNKNEKEDLFILFLILFLLGFGLYQNLGPKYLLFLGFFSFILIFFADEKIFSSVYFSYKKNIIDLKVGDKIINPIKEDNKILINNTESLSREDILLISEKNKSKLDIDVKKVLPYGSLVAINFLIYVFKVITIDKTNLDLLSFLFKFLIFSFIIGGILAIGLIFYFYLKNFKTINIKISKIEKISLILLFLFGMVIFVMINFWQILILIPVYLFIKLAKEVEKIMFVSKKLISKIVPGDWIVEDIYVNNKKIFAIEDFKLGIDEKQLEKLNELSKKHKELTKIKVKDGIAFLPPLFIGFLIILFI